MQTILGRMPLRHWPLFAFSFLGPLFFLVLSAALVRAETDNLSIELNKAEDRDGNCVATFVVENGLGQQLDRFNLDLFVFDSKGVISRQVLLDLAPLRKDKTTVARFVLTDGACADTAKVLVNDIPACRASDGQELDCLKNLAVFSRSRIQLVK